MESQLADLGLDPIGPDARTAPVGPGRDQEGLDRRALIARDPLRLAQRPGPVVDPGERVHLVPGVEDDQGDGHLMEVELVDQPIARLPGEVPEQRLPGLPEPVGPVDILAPERPDPPPVGRLGRLERLPREDHPQARLPHAAVPQQDDLGVRVMDRLGGVGSREHVEIQVPDPDNVIFIAERRENRLGRVKGHATTHIGRGLLEDGNRLPAVGSPESDRVVERLRSEQAAIGRNGD